MHQLNHELIDMMISITVYLRYNILSYDAADLYHSNVYLKEHTSHTKRCDYCQCFPNIASFSLQLIPSQGYNASA